MAATVAWEQQTMRAAPIALQQQKIKALCHKRIWRDGRRVGRVGFGSRWLERKLLMDGVRAEAEIVEWRVEMAEWQPKTQTRPLSLLGVFSWQSKPQNPTPTMPLFVTRYQLCLSLMLALSPPRLYPACFLCVHYTLSIICWFIGRVGQKRAMHPFM